MENNLKHAAVMFIGPPGSGKDTQAELLARELGLVHLMTSGLIEAKLKSADQNNPQIIEEKNKWSTGELNSREFVNALVLEKVKEIQSQGKGVIFSGSPRELVEAQQLVPQLEQLYGKSNLVAVNITLSEQESVERNSHRRMCEKNRHPIPNTKENQNMTVCPEDGSPVITRALDDPAVVKHRYQVYQEQTMPVIDFLSKLGYNIVTINGEQGIENVHREILDKLW